MESVQSRIEEECKYIAELCTMIIAIDEAGDFARTSRLISVFAAVHIREAGNILSSIERKFTKWEDGIDSQFRTRLGEVKCKDLPEDQIDIIVKRIFKSRKLVGISAVGFSAIVNPFEAVKKHKDWQVGEVVRTICELVKAGNQEMGNEYKKFTKWVSDLSYEQYAKSIVLGECVHESLRHSIGVASVDKFDKELRDIEYKIDECFLTHKPNKKYWLELLRNMIISLSKKNPVMTPDTWGKKHPFLQKYGMDDDKFNISELYREHIDFYDSRVNIEIRIADLVATVFHRYYNKKQCVNAFSRMRNCRWMPKGMRLPVVNLAGIPPP